MAASVQLPSAVQRASASQVGRMAIVVATLFIITVLLQVAGRAYSSEFGAFPDEPAHFITGLMIRDYIASGAPASPVAYAENYYLHYPKVAFGMWGPLLHITEAVWMLMFPPSRAAILALMALITTATAALLYRVLVNEFGFLSAFAAAVVFIATPVVQMHTGMVMADGLVALMDFGAALAFGHFLSAGKWKYSVQYGLFTCLSILSKGNGVALVLLPAFAILFARRIEMLKRRSLWIGPALILCIAGPWQYYSAKMLSGIIQRQPGWIFAPVYLMWTARLVGLTLFLVAALGFYNRVLVPWKERRADGTWASAAALICSVLLFHSLIPAAGAQERYLIAIIPPVLMFVSAGAALIASRLRFVLAFSHRGSLVTAAVAGVFFATAFSIPKKVHHGFDEVATALENPEYKDSIILVSSEGDGEGMLISELAMREARRPSHIVLRATKVLSQSDWDGARYDLVHHTPDEIMAYLQSVPVEIVVIDSEHGASFPHHKLLKQTIAASPDNWIHIGSYPANGTIDVYRLRSAHKTPGKIRINLPFTLGRSIERNLNQSR